MPAPVDTGRMGVLAHPVHASGWARRPLSALRRSWRGTRPDTFGRSSIRFWRRIAIVRWHRDRATTQPAHRVYGQGAHRRAAVGDLPAGPCSLSGLLARLVLRGLSDWNSTDRPSLGLGDHATDSSPTADGRPAARCRSSARFRPIRARTWTHPVAYDPAAEPEQGEDDPAKHDPHPRAVAQAGKQSNAGQKAQSGSRDCQDESPRPANPAPGYPRRDLRPRHGAVARQAAGKRPKISDRQPEQHRQRPQPEPKHHEIQPRPPHTHPRSPIFIHCNERGTESREPISLPSSVLKSPSGTSAGGGGGGSRPAESCAGRRCRRRSRRWRGCNRWRRPRPCAGQ